MHILPHPPAFYQLQKNTPNKKCSGSRRKYLIVINVSLYSTSAICRTVANFATVAACDNSPSSNMFLICLLMLYSTDDLDLLLRLAFGITAVETGFLSQQIQHALIKLQWCQFPAISIPPFDKAPHTDFLTQSILRFFHKKCHACFIPTTL